MQFVINVTEPEARDLHAARYDPWQTIAIITALAGPEFVARYVAQRAPRPVIQLVLPPRIEKIEFAIGFVQNITPLPYAPPIVTEINLGLRSSATYQIKGRGTVKICRIDKIPMPGPIEIDGEDLICIGTEMQHPWKLGDEIGILVKPAPGRRIELGIDGRAAFALLGENIQTGECEFVDIEGDGVNAELIAAKKALLKLRARLGMPDAPFYFGNSHPYGSG